MPSVLLADVRRGVRWRRGARSGVRRQQQGWDRRPSGARRQGLRGPTLRDNHSPQVNNETLTHP